MTTTKKVNLAQTVRSAAADQGVTQQQLADAAGLSVQSINAWLNGRNPNLSTAAAEAIMTRLGLYITI